MIRSMTGFGRCVTEDEKRRFIVEVKAVNHRYLDLNIKMPRKLYAFESALRSLTGKTVQRGKVDMYITLENKACGDNSIRYNREAAGEYLKFLEEMKEEFGLEDDIRLSTLSRYPEVFTLEEAKADDEEIWSLLEKAVEGALEQFSESREKEGENLKQDLLDKLEGMKSKVAQIEEQAPQVIKDYQERLFAKVKEMLSDSNIDENRILMETAVFADRVCVDEETVRLKSHIDHMITELERGGAVGRKLDFLAQEMNREANTTLSKSSDLTITGVAIELKTEIEKIREQVQNLE
ncbi:MAG: YicC family protein [Lachnospiraceae bacterium]|nr:YicC family protein [Lachnospiraceae bacterium]